MPLRWIPLADGRVTAAGAPGRVRLAQWAAQGATDVLTLQRADEHAPDLPARCAEAGLRWHHIPLSGRRLQRPADRDSLKKIPGFLAVLRAPQAPSVVVHCSAGLHRTGVCLYLLLRHSGCSSEDAVARIAQARPLTGDELRRVTRKHGALRDRAEEIFQGG